MLLGISQQQGPRALMRVYRFVIGRCVGHCMNGFREARLGHISTEDRVACAPTPRWTRDALLVSRGGMFGGIELDFVKFIFF